MPIKSLFQMKAHSSPPPKSTILIQVVCACVCLSDTTILHFNSPAEPASAFSIVEPVAVMMRRGAAVSMAEPVAVR